MLRFDGEWSNEAADKNALNGDLGLVLKSKAKHAAISSRFRKPFVFKGNSKPLVVQYEINFQVRSQNFKLSATVYNIFKKSRLFKKDWKLSFSASAF